MNHLKGIYLSISPPPPPTTTSPHKKSLKLHANNFTLFVVVNLLQTLIMGNRDDIDEMSSTNASVVLSILKLIDKYDLYGQVAYPKHHKQSDVPDIYRLAAKTKVLISNLFFKLW